MWLNMWLNNESGLPFGNLSANHLNKTLIISSSPHPTLGSLPLNPLTKFLCILVLRPIMVCYSRSLDPCRYFVRQYNMVSFHYGADHYDACQYGDSTIAQVQLGASRYGAFQYGAGPVWRCFGMALFSMAQIQLGASWYGAGPVRRVSVWRSSCLALRSPKRAVPNKICAIVARNPEYRP